MLSKFKALTEDNQFIKNYKRMWPFIKPYWGMALLGVLLTIPVGSLDAVVAMLLKPFMDNVLVEKQQVFSATLPFIIVGFTLLQSGLTYFSSYVNSWVGNKITIGIKRKLYDKLLSMDSSYFDRHDSGSILFRYSTDAEVASNGLVNNLKMFLSKFFSSISLVAVLIYNSWQLSILAVSVLFLAIYPLKIVRKKIDHITNKTVGAGSNIMTIYNETFNGNKIIHSFTLEKQQRKRFEITTDFIFKLSMKMAQGSNWLSPLMHVIGSIGIALVIGFGSHLIVAGTITSGNFVAFIAALLMLYTPLRSIGNNYIVMRQSFLAIDRIFDILNLTPSIASAEDAYNLETIKKDIVFKDVVFGYNPEIEVLHGVNFNIKVGETVALVGNSGGGKTTIVSLIPRLYEVAGGEICIDGTNIKQYSVESLRRNISMVFQDNFLFSGSIRENIMLGNSDVKEDELMKAVRDAYLEDFVVSLPSGLDTQIGERGILLSGGQKQRLAIARALVKNAPLVILDEATSALDNTAERYVQQALDNLMRNRTIIVIAHRLSTVQNADRILVVNNGAIVEQGNHTELLAKDEGFYKNLYQTHFLKEKTIAKSSD